MSAFLVDSFPALLDIAVKSLVMLAVGAAAASVLHRASAALRHFVFHDPRTIAQKQNRNIEGIA